MKSNKGKLLQECVKCAEISLEMLPVKITHMIIVPLFAQKSIRRYGEDEKGSKMSTKYEEEVIRKLEGREQRIEERFREGLRQLLSCSSILTTI